MSRQGLRAISNLIDQAKDRLTAEQSFLNDLKRSIELTAEEERRLPSQTYKPSSMTCIRNMWYQVTGQEQDRISANYCLIGICNSGSDIHVRVQNAVERMRTHNIDCDYIDVADFVKQRNLSDIEIVARQGVETKLYHKKLNMSFLCDGIIRYKNHYYVLELKTETSYKWNTRKGVDESHYAQGTAYSIAFNIPEILFVYINRDILDMKSFMFVPTDEMKEELIGKIEECDSYVKSKTCPPKPEDVLKKSCEYCAYRNKCREDGE